MITLISLEADRNYFWLLQVSSCQRFLQLTSVLRLSPFPKLSLHFFLICGWIPLFFPQDVESTGSSGRKWITILKFTSSQIILESGEFFLYYCFMEKISFVNKSLSLAEGRYFISSWKEQGRSKAILRQWWTEGWQHQWPWPHCF